MRIKMRLLQGFYIRKRTWVDACGARQDERDFCKIFRILHEWESYFDENLPIEAYKNHVNPLNHVNPVSTAGS